MRDLLAPIGMAYGAIVKVRSFLYAKDFLKRKRLSKPVISIGNLTVGGTGKTPVVDFLLTQFENQNLKVCVLTRGYGRITATREPQVLDQNSSPELCGDEPVWLAKRHPSCTIVVGADRVESANSVKDVDLYILDDGLQHLKIVRDFDIVLLDCTAPCWHYRPLPWGYGREEFSGVKRSDLVILTRANQVQDQKVEMLKKWAKDGGASKIIESRLLTKGCQDIWTQVNVDIKNKNVFLVSGIGNSKSFEDSARSFGAHIVGHDIRRDHYRYTQKNVDEIISQSKKAKAQIILTTEKDSIKLKELNFHKKDFLVAHLVIGMEFEPALLGIYDLAVDHFR